MLGKVVLIGAGPGNPDLLTLKGKEYIENADCIVYDRLASKELLSFARKDCELIYVGKANHHHTMKQDDINELLLKKAEKYPLIVRLKGGDPYVFGRGGEEAVFLKEKAVCVEVVSGISSCIAALATAGIPITHRGVSKGFQVVTAHSKKDSPADIDYSQLLDTTITYVFLMGLAHVKEIANGLVGAGRNINTPVAVISNGTTPVQKKCIGTLDNIATLVEENKLESPAIIVVGDVVGLSAKLDFFEKRPLFGKKYMVPYIEKFCFSFADGIFEEKKEGHFNSELEKKLRQNGAEVFSLRVGKIEPIKIDKEELVEALNAKWLLFTSQNGVHSFLWNLKESGLDIRAIAKSKIAVVGSRTARCFEEIGINPDLIPQKQYGKSLCKDLKDILEKDNQVIFFAAKNSNPEIEELLKDECLFKKIVCYENVIAYDKDYNFKSIFTEEVLKSFDGVIFTSGSSVNRTLQLIGGVCPDKIYSIGPKCSAELINNKITKYEEAKIFNYKGIIDILLN